MADFISDDFTFEEDKHLYRNGRGIIRPSVTGLLKSVGIFNYSMVPLDVLENARRRGSNVHSHTEEIDRFGEIEQTWIAEDEQPYVDAWLKFRNESGFFIRDIETPLMRPILGVEVGGTPDRIGFFKADRFVIDIKTCAARHPGWGLQLCLYEMLITGKDRCGHMGRMVVMLKRNGKYDMIPYEDPSDASCALSIVQKLGAEEAIANWMSNHNLKAA